MKHKLVGGAGWRSGWKTARGRRSGKGSGRVSKMVGEDSRDAAGGERGMGK